MNAGSGTTLIKIEPPQDLELRVALTIEQGNNCVLQHTIKHQLQIIQNLNRVIALLNSRSSN